MRSDPAAEKRAMKDCDALFGKLMHATMLEVCGYGGCCDGPIEMAHIIPRGKSWFLRCNRSNVMMLCRSHHQGPRGVDRNGWKWPDLIGDDAYDALYLIARSEGKKPHDWFRNERIRLRAEIRASEHRTDDPVTAGWVASPAVAVESGQAPSSPVPTPAELVSPPRHPADGFER